MKNLKKHTQEVAAARAGMDAKTARKYISNNQLPSDTQAPHTWKTRAIKKKAPQAIHVLDRFHIVAKINKAIDEVRASEHKKMQADGYEPILKNSRWCLLKRKENLTEKQDLKLRDLVKYNLKSVRAYLLKNDFESFWNYVSPTWAGKFLDKWCTRTMRSKIEPMKKAAKTIRKHKLLILNWFVAKKQLIIF